MSLEMNDAACSELKRTVEAILFATQEPISAQELHEYLPEGADVGGILLDLQKDYDGRGVHLVAIDNLWAFRTAVDLEHIFTVEKDVERDLSKAAMETLAIVAYHQPVTRTEIENIRGVSTHRGTLDQLIEAGWVKPGRRRESPGRPLTWVTTHGFLDHFSLTDIKDLPGFDDLEQSGLLDARPAIDAALDTEDDLFTDQGNDTIDIQDEEEIIL